MGGIPKKLEKPFAWAYTMFLLSTYPATCHEVKTLTRDYKADTSSRTILKTACFIDSLNLTTGAYCGIRSSSGQPTAQIATNALYIDEFGRDIQGYIIPPLDSLEDRCIVPMGKGLLSSVRCYAKASKFEGVLDDKPQKYEVKVK